jgi:hypothetical protein
MLADTPTHQSVLAAAFALRRARRVAAPSRLAVAAHRGAGGPSGRPEGLVPDGDLGGHRPPGRNGGVRFEQPCKLGVIDERASHTRGEDS